MRHPAGRGRPLNTYPNVTARAFIFVGTRVPLIEKSVPRVHPNVIVRDEIRVRGVVMSTMERGTGTYAF